MAQDDLLRRFEALKGASQASVFALQDDVIRDKARQAQAEDDEIARIAEGRLGISGKAENTPKSRSTFMADSAEEANESDGDIDASEVPRFPELHSMNKQVEAFLASLGTVPVDPLPAPASSSELDHLARAAQELLHESRTPVPAPPSSTTKRSAHTTFSPPSPAPSPRRYTDEETSDEIVARAIDEALLEGGSRSSWAGPRHVKLRRPPGEKRGKDEIGEDVDGARNSPLREETPEQVEQDKTEGSSSFEYAWPGVPQHAVALETEDTAEEDEKMKRLLALNAPAENIPTTRAKTESTPPQDDVGSWCCICTEDAEVICRECDDDPYCLACWTDGHGEGEGKERGHRARKFVRK
ncbi:hypothetical protein P7C73_g6221, partial [Tremellales sp. Uapishka_1]